MRHLMSVPRRFLHDDDGATMVEYAIMLVLIAAVAIAIVRGLGTKVNTAFNSTNTAWTP